MPNLPRIDHPTFTAVMPSDKKTVRFRPFTGREQKVLLVAKEAKDSAGVMRAVADVVQASVLDTYNVYSMPIFDLEYLFVCIRAKSVSNASEVRVLGDDGKYHEAVVDLDKAKVIYDDAHASKRVVKLNDSSGIKLKYPTVRSVIDAGPDQDELDVLASSIDIVYNGEETMTPGDFSRAEVREWLSGMPLSVLESVREFFETRPQVELVATYDGGSKTMRGLGDFFESA